MRLYPLMIVLCVTVPPAVSAQQKPDAGRRARVFVTDSNSWETKAHSAAGFGAAGGVFGGGGFTEAGGGARPQTAEVIKTLGKRCPNIIVNNRLEMGDYVLRLEHEGGKGWLAHKNKVAVFVRSSGDSIFSTSTLSLGGSVEDACGAVEKHWAANATALAATAAAPAASEKASLTVESTVAGADIEVDGEFTGSAPSTLAVAAGKHTIVVKKKGYTVWTRTMTVAGSAVHLSAELEALP